LVATKVKLKEYLPIIDKSIVQDALEVAIVAGIAELILVTGRNEGAVGNNPFTVFLANDLMRGRLAPAEALVETLGRTLQCVLSVNEVPLEDVSRYGVVRLGAVALDGGDFGRWAGVKACAGQGTIHACFFRALCV
jgi:UTP-glucose-1-phosphate uridylyltransferase